MGEVFMQRTRTVALTLMAILVAQVLAMPVFSAKLLPETTLTLVKGLGLLEKRDPREH